MFILDKLVTPLFTALGLALALMVLAWLLVLFRRRGAALTVLGIAVIGLYAASTDFVAQQVSGILERQYPPVPLASLPKADAIILLGGMTDPPFPPRQAPDLSAHADRAMLAADLYKAGKAPVVIASGGNWRYPAGTDSEAVDMAAVLERFGVPQSAILLEDKSADTAENARFSAAIMQAHHLARALLVTSGVHMPRAVATFRAAGVDVVPAATDIVDAPAPGMPFAGLAPRGDALNETGEALHELVGFVYYRLRGRI